MRNASDHEGGVKETHNPHRNIRRGQKNKKEGGYLFFYLYEKGLCSLLSR